MWALIMPQTVACCHFLGLRRAAGKGARQAVMAMAMSALVYGCATVPYQTALFDAQYNAPYTLSSGDRLRIIVFGQDTLSNSYSVDGSGNISMPLIGLVEVKGIVTNEAERLIEAKLRNGFVREPRVSVEVEAFRPFYILGEVTTSGQFPYVNGMNIQNAVAIAGGFSPRAYQSGADLTRMINGRPVTGRVPITQPVRPGDTIVIRERIF